jgi:hypothetical protein
MQRSVIKDVEIKALLKQALTHQIDDLVGDTEFVIKYHVASPSISATMASISRRSLSILLTVVLSSVLSWVISITLFAFPVFFTEAVLKRKYVNIWWIITM